MYISRIVIRNFRNFKHLDLKINDGEKIIQVNQIFFGQYALYWMQIYHQNIENLQNLIFIQI